ncbi:cytosine/adenosine deaminase-related metal-dependent hydrolase [Actinoplanes lutulentus]|uniref:Cytosine/adenosine deaminase-related metal-dependent hydrolase n=1 Tax=Actinoplanes lutulentus TaxID=1287878 RepID=A0A327ZKT8_9ACTN|nr:amidohydrolase family protein [Actinoplanes lutulentus]MBB2940583.1 cytosine/adenosine deaminase-related metal-dependent hydrolase [Actinoplanes lutulentus]RAK42895.1 cytosine/adenosine deaminase-related metal-dependent hydrolase [Actinoplanes lutulentus]
MPSLLIRGGHVLTMDPVLGDLPDGDILIEGDTIVAIAPRIETCDAELVDATGTIVMPGFVDTHRHLWQGALGQIAADWTMHEYRTGLVDRYSPLFTPGDVRDGTFFGALEALDGGVTTVFDSSHVMHTPEHADAAVEALKAAGLRAVFGYGSPTEDLPHPYDARRIAAEQFSSREQLVTLGLALRGPETATLDTTAADIALGRELGVPVSMPVGLGRSGQGRSIARLRERGLLGEDLLFVHCTNSTDEELTMIAGSGGHVSVSARAEMMMGHGLPATGRMIEAGLRPGLSAGVPGSMFDEIRATLQAERAHRASRRGLTGGRPRSVGLTSRQVLELATIDGARTLGMADRIGSLAPGKRADIIVIDASRRDLRLLYDAAALATCSNTADIDTVLVNGEFRKRDGRLVGVDPFAARIRAEASRDRLVTIAAG